MDRLALSPVPSNWLVVLLLLLPAGEMVAKNPTVEQHQDSAGSPCSQIWQHPRYMAKKRGSVVLITCYMEAVGEVSWLWTPKMELEPNPLHLEEGRIEHSQTNTSVTLTIRDIQFQDNGIYFCQQKCSGDSSGKGCGTELRVLGFSTVAQLKRRNTLKDGIIMIQTLLIILFVIVPIFLLLDKDDSKAGMEEDHTYEGLNIDQTATYEDIVTLRTGEVKWSVGEHPGQE
ncbi:PREDICTED: B-cell antigen receptor complex-associated protein beta chain isoform X1 [Hipposideros armiger]|uniref:B-cell antigen receptor complex-associated protein beta chain n=1 Tax=Hipposideros armiger TaxID=186990 RepID=A0A8B7QWV7_HIPAR|nr:PREDICTED: B-cell antigen receptor complex-associated protein beta chain isoform X1 [Hipposideros armiger]